ncbi:hypothetical protein MKY37_18310 [Psychrobacillus sp. FSL K6-2836]|uniref:hypothetical protein n=1 Tax=Psychrobacillus sp. FSL K6-2836 TaxID=2921548 RepID=UPI0030F8F583
MGKALGEDPAAKTLAKLCLGNIFATSNRMSICFPLEEAEATATESIHLKRKSVILFIFKSAANPVFTDHFYTLSYL